MSRDGIARPLARRGPRLGRVPGRPRRLERAGAGGERRARPGTGRGRGVEQDRPAPRGRARRRDPRRRRRPSCGPASRSSASTSPTPAPALGGARLRAGRPRRARAPPQRRAARRRRPDFSEHGRHRRRVGGHRARGGDLRGPRPRARRPSARMLEGTLQRLGARRAAIAAELAGVEAQAVARRRGRRRQPAARRARRDDPGRRSATSSARSPGCAAPRPRWRRSSPRPRPPRPRPGSTAPAPRPGGSRRSRRSRPRSPRASRSIAPEIAALEARLSRFEIVAPVAGTVVDLSVATIGGVVAPGAPLLRIVPDGRDPRHRGAGAARRPRAPRPGHGRRSPSARRRAARREQHRRRRHRHLRRPRRRRRGGRGPLPPDRRPRRIGAPARLAPGLPVTVVVPTMPRSVIAYLLSPLRDAIARSMREV